MKSLYATYAIVATLVRLPFWLICFVPRKLRQHPAWTFRQALTNEFFKSYLYYSSLVRVRTPLTLEPGAEQERFVAIPPATEPIYQGIAVNSAVKPGMVGATWYPSPLMEEDVDGQVPVVLHFHGGAVSTWPYLSSTLY